METTNNENRDFWNDIVSLVIAIAVSVAFLLLTSCRSARYVEVPTIKTEYKVRTDTLRLSRVDSIYQRDSVYLTKWLQGDTLYIYKERTAYKYKFLADTVYKIASDTIIKTDSVAVPYPVERELTKWERRYMIVGKLVIGLIPACVFWVGFTVWLRRRK